MDRTLKKFDELASLTQDSLVPQAPEPAAVASPVHEIKPAPITPPVQNIRPGPSIFSTRTQTVSPAPAKASPSKTPSELIAMLLRERAMNGRLQRSSSTRVVKPEHPAHFQPDAIPEVQIAPKNDSIFSRTAVYKVIK